MTISNSGLRLSHWTLPTHKLLNYQHFAFVKSCHGSKEKRYSEGSQQYMFIFCHDRCLLLITEILTVPLEYTQKQQCFFSYQSSHCAGLWWTGTLLLTVLYSPFLVPYTIRLQPGILRQHWGLIAAHLLGGYNCPTVLIRSAIENSFMLYGRPQSTYFTVRGQSKILTPHPPLRPPLLRGEDRLAGRRGGWGVNILEDERNRIVLLQ